ncbi:unnamed protein product [Rhizophagus irregularis]|nr:unnamed protein product [Rhizophagus irregularis]
MSVHSQTTKKRHSSKKKVEDSSFNTSNSSNYSYISQRSNEYEFQDTTEKLSIHSSGKEGLEDYVLNKFKTLNTHYNDNPEILNMVTLLKRGRRKERLNQLDNLTRERRVKQKQQQQQQQQQSSHDPHYLGKIDDLLIKSHERSRVKHNDHGSKNVRIQSYQESDDDQRNDIIQENFTQMNDFTVNQKDINNNKQPLAKSLSQPLLPTEPPPNTVNTGIRNLVRPQANKGFAPKSKKYDSENIHSYMNYKAKLQEKAKREKEYDLIRKQVIKEETNRRLKQLEEFRRKQRKEKLAQLQEAKNRELKLNENIIDDEYQEIRKQQRRERMAEIARESRDSSINYSLEEDNENIEYWENLTPSNIGWKEFLSVSQKKENDNSQFYNWTLNADQPDKYEENILKALAPDQSFKQILKERYVLQPVIGKGEQQIIEEKDEMTSLSHPRENQFEPTKPVGVQIQKSLDNKKLKKGSQLAPQISNQPQSKQKIQKETPISKPPLKSIQRSHSEGRPKENIRTIAKVQGWLNHFEKFDEPEKIENNSKVPSPSNIVEDCLSSDSSTDNETSTMGDSKPLLDLLSKIRSTKTKLNARDKAALELHQKTLETMQKIVTDLIEKHDEIAERDQKIKDGKKHVRELLNTITGKDTRDIIDALSISLDQPPENFGSTSNSLDALLKQLQKATDGLKNVEGQLNRKEKRLKTALEIAQDLVDKRLNLINWERKLQKHEQRVNKISSHIGESKDSSIINQRNDGSRYIGSVLGSFIEKKESENNKNLEQDQENNAIRPSTNSGPSRSQKEVCTEDGWEKIVVRSVPENDLASNNSLSANNDRFCGQIDKNNGKPPSAEINEQKYDENLNDMSHSTIKSSETNQMTVISQMDEYLLLLEKHKIMKEYLGKIGDNQQSIKDYLSKADNNRDVNCSAINSEYFRPNVTFEETAITEVIGDTPIEKKVDKGNGKQINNFTPTLPALPTFDQLTNENLLETEPNIEDSDSDWQELTSRFNGLSSARNKIAKQKSSKRVSKPTPLNKFSKKVPTTGSLARNGDWENIVLKIQNKSHLQKTPNFLSSKKDDHNNNNNISNSNFFVNTEGKLGGIFANASQTSSTGTVKNFNKGVIDAKNNAGPLTTNQKGTLTSERSISLNLGDYVSRSFPASQKILEKEKKEDICEQTNSMISQEIPKYNFEGKQEHNTNINIKDNNDAIENSDDNNNNDSENMQSESGLDFSEVVNSLPGWKSFVRWLQEA